MLAFHIIDLLPWGQASLALQAEIPSSRGGFEGQIYGQTHNKS